MSSSVLLTCAFPEDLSEMSVDNNPESISRSLCAPDRSEVLFLIHKMLRSLDGFEAAATELENAVVSQLQVAPFALLSVNPLWEIILLQLIFVIIFHAFIESRYLKEDLEVALLGMEVSGRHGFEIWMQYFQTLPPVSWSIICKSRCLLLLQDRIFRQSLRC